jgi:hypothetical protein
MGDPMQLRWVHSTALTIGICVPRSVPAPIPQQDLTLLDRLRHERARAPVSEAADANDIAQLSILLVTGIANGSNHQATKAPRSAARDRVAAHHLGVKAATAGAIFTTSCSKAASHRFCFETQQDVVPLQKQSRNRSDAKGDMA